MAIATAVKSSFGSATITYLSNNGSSVCRRIATASTGSSNTTIPLVPITNQRFQIALADGSQCLDLAAGTTGYIQTWDCSNVSWNLESSELFIEQYHRQILSNCGPLISTSSNYHTIHGYSMPYHHWCPLAVMLMKKPLNMRFLSWLQAIGDISRSAGTSESV